MPKLFAKAGLYSERCERLGSRVYPPFATAAITAHDALRADFLADFFLLRRAPFLPAFLAAPFFVPASSDAFSAPFWPRPSLHPTSPAAFSRGLLRPDFFAPAFRRPFFRDSLAAPPPSPQSRFLAQVNAARRPLGAVRPPPPTSLVAPAPARTCARRARRARIGSAGARGRRLRYSLRPNSACWPCCI